MTKGAHFHRAFSLAVLLGFFAPAYASCTVVDDAGNTIELNQPARRIISLAPDITETLFAIGGGQHIIGVMAGSDYPLSAARLPVIGSYSGIDLERIISLRPHLIVTWGRTFSRQLRAVKSQGIPVYIVEPHRLEDVAHTMKNLGCLLGTEKIASKAATLFSQRLAALSARYAKQKEVTVFYQLGSYSLITINKESWINQALTLCGGRNIFKDAKTLAPEVSWEAVLSRNPQVIISGETGRDWKKRWQPWSEITAVKQQLLFQVQADLLHRAGPRLVDGVQELCGYLQAARSA